MHVTPIDHLDHIFVTPKPNHKYTLIQAKSKASPQRKSTFTSKKRPASTVKALSDSSDGEKRPRPKKVRVCERERECVFMHVSMCVL
jgi:hypothetical protein